MSSPHDHAAPPCEPLREAREREACANHAEPPAARASAVGPLGADGDRPSESDDLTAPSAAPREGRRALSLPLSPPGERVKPPPPRPASIASSSGATASPLQRAVRVDPGGTVLARMGEVDALAGLAVYATRIADLVGGAFGLEKLLAVDLELDGGRCLLWVEDDGNVVAVQGKAGERLGAIARRAGL